MTGSRSKKPHYDEPEPDWFPNEGDRQWWRERHQVKPLTRKQRRKLLDTPIVFREYGGRSHGGASAYDAETGRRIVGPNTWAYRKSTVWRVQQTEEE